MSAQLTCHQTSQVSIMDIKMTENLILTILFSGDLFVFAIFQEGHQLTDP